LDHNCALLESIVYCNCQKPLLWPVPQLYYSTLQQQICLYVQQEGQAAELVSRFLYHFPTTQLFTFPLFGPEYTRDRRGQIVSRDLFNNPGAFDNFPSDENFSTIGEWFCFQ
jgi:hypothetical protein